MSACRPATGVTIAVLGAFGLIAWCAWVSGFRRGSIEAEVTWAASTLGVVAVGVLLARGRRRQHPGLRLRPVPSRWPPRDRARRALFGAIPWIVFSLVVVVWEILGIDTGTHTPHLTISALTQASRPLNAAVLLVWLLVGLGYGAARGRMPYPTSADGDNGPAIDEPTGAAAASSPGGLGLHGAPSVLLPASRGAGVAFWLAILGSLVAVDAVARRSDGRVATAEEILRLLSGALLLRIVLVGVWAYAGYHLFAR